MQTFLFRVHDEDVVQKIAGLKNVVIFCYVMPVHDMRNAGIANGSSGMFVLLYPNVEDLESMLLQ